MSLFAHPVITSAKIHNIAVKNIDFFMIMFPFIINYLDYVIVALFGKEWKL